MKIYGFVLRDKTGWLSDPIKRVFVFATTESKATNFLRESYKKNDWSIINSYVHREKITEGDYI